MEFEIMSLKLDASNTSLFIDEHSKSDNTPLLLSKNENSIQALKHMTQEFFERVFSPSGPYWTIYSDLGFASIPTKSTYVIFVNGQMYFVKNIENRYLNNVGPEKSFEILNNMFIIKRKPNFQNLLLSLSAPFDAIHQVKRKIELGFMANEYIKKFEDFKEQTLSYQNQHSLNNKTNMKDLIKTANECLDLAVESLIYSNMASLSYNLKIKLRKSDSISDCESEKINHLVKQGDFKTIQKSFGFYSLWPYDISKPRFREDTKDIQKYGFPESPRNYALKWRENAKYLCARYLDIQRLALQQFGKQTGLGEYVFFLTTRELERSKYLTRISKQRKAIFDKYTDLPAKLVYFKGKYYEPKDSAVESTTFQAMNVASKKTVSGPVVNINSLSDYEKCKDGSIIVSKTLSPNISILFKNAIGVIAENGGVLSHSAVIAREQDIPCLIQADFISQLHDGEVIEINGKTGRVRKLEKNNQ